jgi:predicted metal-binding protein
MNWKQNCQEVQNFKNEEDSHKWQESALSSVTGTAIVEVASLFRAIRERQGAFAHYPADETVEIIGYSTCGGCPGGNVEHVPEEFKKNGADVIHLATGLVVGYPPCPYIHQFKTFIETIFRLPVAVGTHPIPLKYYEIHQQLPFWKEGDMHTLAGDLMNEAQNIMEPYN